jgi:hypothetical protein
LLTLAARAKRIDRIEWLLQHGVTLDTASRLPLIRIAGEQNNTTLMGYLLSNGMIISELPEYDMIQWMCRMVDRGHSDMIVWMIEHGYDMWTPRQCTCYNSNDYPPAEAYNPPSDPFAGSHSRHPPWRQKWVPSKPVHFTVAYESPLPLGDALLSLAMVDNHWDMVRCLGSQGCTVYELSLTWACAASAKPFHPTPDAIKALRSGKSSPPHLHLLFLPYGMIWYRL